YKNVATADSLIRTSAIRENFRRQEHALRIKIINKEIYGTVNAHVDRIKQPEGVVGSNPNSFSANASSNDCHTGPPRTDLSKTAIRKIRKLLLQDYEKLLQNQKRIYHKQLEQVEYGLPAINPYVTLSCAGLGRLFGASASTGHYQQQKLLKEGVIRVEAHFEKINRNVAAVYENMQQMRHDVFSYNYPVKRGPTGRED